MGETMKKKDNKKALSKPEEDRVIADMNIEGMPWYVSSKPLYQESVEPNQPLTKKELWRLTLNALVASLLVAMIFLTAFFLFIMFCIHIWF
jgi:hypothetical protein